MFTEQDGVLKFEHSRWTVTLKGLDMSVEPDPGLISMGHLSISVYAADSGEVLKVYGSGERGAETVAIPWPILEAILEGRRILAALPGSHARYRGGNQ